MTNLDLTQVIPAKLSVSEVPSRDPDISRAERDTIDKAQFLARWFVYGLARARTDALDSGSAVR